VNTTKVGSAGVSECRIKVELVEAGREGRHANSGGVRLNAFFRSHKLSRILAPTPFIAYSTHKQDMKN
jgi:hypothetical protein